MSRLVFVNRVFTPDESATAQLLHDLATALAALGRTVVVVTTGDTRLPRRERVQGVEVLRIAGGARPRRGLLRRALQDAGAWAGLVRATAREARRGDVVIALTDPPLLGVGLTWALGRRVPLYHWCQDVYPEVAMALAGGGWRRGWFEPLRRVRDASWRRGAGCVVLGADMQRLVLSRGLPANRVTVSPNWAPHGIGPVNGLHLRRHWRIADRFVITYSGNLGRVHALQPLLQVAERLRQDERLVFLLIGQGAQRAALERHAAGRGLAQVQFHPPQPRLRLPEVLAASDLQVITLRPGCAGTVWPSKFYGIVAAHRPILFIGPPEAELADLVVTHGLGGSFAPDDLEGIGAFIRRLAADPAEGARIRERVAAFAATLPGLSGAIETWLGLVGPADARARTSPC